MKRTFLVALRMLLLAIAILFCAILAEGTIDISKWCEDTRGISISVFSIGFILIILSTSDLD